MNSGSRLMTSLAGWLGKALLFIGLSGVAGNAVAAGYAPLQVAGTGSAPALQAIVWSPCADAAASAQLGPYVVRGVKDCAVMGEALPLVVISHGQGGSLLGHHDTTQALADAGFVVVAFNHPGDTFGDDSAAQQLAIFESRPADVSRVVSYMLDAWPTRQQLDPAAIGVFGFSRGGYTALALIGAKPSLDASATRYCDHWWSITMSLCRQIKSSSSRLAPAADPRIRAAVVADPLNLFDAAGLASVQVPVQLWASEQGGDGVQLSDVEAIRTALSQAPEYHVAEGAGHFAYLAPCPPELAASARSICEDPAGFDRAAWHEKMNKAVVRFLRNSLQPAAH